MSHRVFGVEWKVW